MEQEALLFAEQNGHAAPLSAGIRLRAKVVGGDAPSKAFVAATNRVGLSLNYDSMQLSDYRISCVGTALKLYDQLGEEIYCEALRHIVEAWEGRPDSFRAAVLRGVMYFVQLYHGQYSAERLVRALSGVHPMELYRISRDNPAKLPGWRRYVYPIYTTYERQQEEATVQQLLDWHRELTDALQYAVDSNWLRVSPIKEVDPCLDNSLVLFNDFITDWLKMMKSRVAITTYANYEIVITRRR